MKILRYFEWIAITLLLAGFVWFYRGFYSVDPFYFSGSSSGGLTKALLVVRILLPVVAILLLALYIGVRTKRVAYSSIFVLLVSSLLGAIVLYIPASHFYYNYSSANQVNGYHPYLQLAPTKLELKAVASNDSTPFRIFFIGGSSTAWPDSKGVDWPSLVCKELSKLRPGNGIECYNQAREWYNSQHGLINYSVNLRQHRPNTLVIMHAVNDLMINADFNWTSTGEFREDYGHFYGPVTRLVKRQSLFAMLFEKFNASWYHSPRQVISTTTFQGLSQFQRNIQSIIALAKQDGTKVVLLTEPYLYKEQMTAEELSRLTMLNFFAIGKEKQWDLSTVKSGMEQYNLALANTAKSTNSGFYDLAGAIPKELRYIRDDVHYTDEAFPLIATSIAPYLLQYLFENS